MKTTTTAAPYLHVTAFSAGYTHPVFSPLDFTLRPGEALGILGPNGCGKSTLLNALIGNARCFSGKIERAPSIQMTLQTQKQPELTGIPLSAQELLSLTGALTHQQNLPLVFKQKLHWRLDQLSGGQRQFLHLWACLYASGDIVLLDEPTNNLDPAGVTALIHAIQHRKASGHAMIIVSHDPHFLPHVCTHTLSLEKT